MPRDILRRLADKALDALIRERHRHIVAAERLEKKIQRLRDALGYPRPRRNE